MPCLINQAHWFLLSTKHLRLARGLSTSKILRSLPLMKQVFPRPFIYYFLKVGNLNEQYERKSDETTMKNTSR